jgi:hypothetical protein
MKSIAFSSIKNEIALKTKIKYNRMGGIYYHSYRDTLAASTSYNIAFTNIAIATNNLLERDFKSYAKINPRMRTYAVRLDAGCIMSEYKE